MRRASISLVCRCGIMFALASNGCKEFGAISYYIGTALPKDVKADYKLPTGPVLVLVDDDQGLISPPTAKLALVDAMARELKAHNITNKVTTNEEIARLRQAEPKFDQRGARELGRMAEVKTVLLLSTQAFSLDDDLETANSAGKFTVTVRVINANAEKANEVRLWPPEVTEREGHLVEASVPAHLMRRIKTPQEAHEKLAEELATKVTEMFYDRKVEQNG